MEINYEFRNRMNQYHLPNRRNPTAIPAEDEIVIDSSWQIRIPKTAGKILRNSAKDLQDYFEVSMGISVSYKMADLENVPPKTIVLADAPQLPQYADGLAVPRSYHLIVEESSVVVCGYDEAGTMQGGFFLEDLMNLRRAPFLCSCDQIKQPLYSPRMIHSGFGKKAEFTESLLCNIAHYGFDTIFCPNGIDHRINDLIDLAEGYGLQVYAFSEFESNMHPEDPGAEAYYDSNYGALFKACPKLKGIVLVGESVGFPSKDPHVMNRGFFDIGGEGLPSEKPTSSHWPCYDYPQWLNVVKNAVRKHAPQADVVFWTYNWGWAPEEDRVKLIRSLPTDISLLATFEMFEQRHIDGINTSCVDYTLSFAGPGKYFESEAKAAKERGIRLYSMTNTGGNTWDFGAVPYEPAPYQWIDRYEAMDRCRREYGLCGLMESHTYGFWPSFICELAKWAFWSGGPDSRTVLRQMAIRDYGEVNADTVLEVFRLWSDGIRAYISTNEDQYGPCRIGPSYPLTFNKDVQMPDGTYVSGRSFYMVFMEYASRVLQAATVTSDAKSSTISQRMPVTRDHMLRCAACFEKGVSLLEGIWNSLSVLQKKQAEYVLGVAKFVAITCHTTANVKQWFMLKNRLMAETDGEKIAAYCREMIALGKQEIENAKAAIPLVRHDSRLGWEASMGYVTDEYHISWKIRQVEWVIGTELPRYIELALG